MQFRADRAEWLRGYAFFSALKEHFGGHPWWNWPTDVRTLAAAEKSPLRSELAHRIEAGSDLFVMPSKFEPCGLNQLYSLRYGTVPVVRATGGLADTVTDTTPETLSRGIATGFCFEAANVSILEGTLRRAVETYWQNQDVWQQLVETGMRQDWSWAASAQHYEQAYIAAKSRHKELRERLKAQK